MAHSNKPTLNKLKTSSLDRRLSMAKTSLNIGKRWASNSLGGLLVDKQTRELRKQAFMQEQSQYLVEELGKLKGSVVKIGQMMALYSEHLLPPEVTKALHTLNDNTATLSWHIMQPVIAQQLGSKINDLQIDPIPIGTASLAQVHKATIKQTGEQVVLKVQYPGVADAIDSDLNMFTQLLKVSNTVPQTRAFDTWVDEIRDLLYREVDYALEAKTTKNFYQRLQHDARYVVPKIIDEYSTAQIICMTYEHGLTISDKRLKKLSQQRRDDIGQAAIDIILGEIFTWGEMQTDPNFGNYLIRLAENDNEPDKIVLLDFGAIRQFDDDLLNIAQSLLLAGFNHDKQQMIKAMSNTNYEFFNNMSLNIKADMADVFLLGTEPLANAEKLDNFVWLDDNGNYIWAASDLHARIMQRARAAAQSFEFSIPPKEFMFISRKFIGAYTLLTVLDARTNAQQMVEKFIR